MFTGKANIYFELQHLNLQKKKASTFWTVVLDFECSRL